MDLPIDEIHAYIDRAQIDQAGEQRQALVKPAHKPAQSNQEKEIDAETYLFGKDGFTFEDFLDIINPLQHLPVISTIYRELTGDKIAKMPRILGGTLFGGPIGAGVAIVNSAIVEGSGKDIGEHVVAWFKDDSTTTLAAKPSETDLVTAAGTQSSAITTTNGKGITVAKASGLVVTPTQAELDILKEEAEAKPNQSAEVRHSSPDSKLPIVAMTAAEQNIIQLETTLARMAQKNKTVSNTENGVRKIAKKVAQEPSLPNQWLPFQTEKSFSTSNVTTINNGAVAKYGGWFSDVMLVALDKYEKTRKLDQTPPQPAINQLN